MGTRPNCEQQIPFMSMATMICMTLQGRFGIEGIPTYRKWIFPGLSWWRQLNLGSRMWQDIPGEELRH